MYAYTLNFRSLATYGRGIKKSRGVLDGITAARQA